MTLWQLTYRRAVAGVVTEILEAADAGEAEARGRLVCAAQDWRYISTVPLVAYTRLTHPLPAPEPVVPPAKAQKPRPGASHGAASV